MYDPAKLRPNPPEDPLAPLTPEEFEAAKEEFRRLEKLRIENRPPAQGDYQWDGGFLFDGSLGEYQALYFNGRKIGGMFVNDGKYYCFSPEGYRMNASVPPVEHVPFPGMPAITLR